MVSLTARFPTLCIVFILLVSCQNTANDHPVVSFYYWKTIFKLNLDEREALLGNGVSKLYVRYFDLQLKNGTVGPVAPIVFEDKPERIFVVPVIYIKNEVMLERGLNVDDLAKKVLSLIEQINSTIDAQCSEIQFDCDWTVSSREYYFKFIDAVKSRTKKKISATIRLHQLKYLDHTGVPNVDYGTLMYYNMGNISLETVNSIYEQKTALRYLPSLNAYPLPLNFALPIYSWGVHIRSHKVIGLLNKMGKDDFVLDDRFVEKDGVFEITKSDYVAGRYFEKGDLVKVESIDQQNIQGMVSDLRAYSLNKKPTEIIFFDLDSINLRRYEKDLFNKAVTAF
jgi:hypothetical protein